MISYWIEKAKIWEFLKSFYIDYKNGIVPPPKYVGWDCSRVCNLNCEHCGAKKEKYTKELETEEIKKVIDQISKMGSKYFEVTGGEPLLRKDLLEVFEYAKSKGLKTSLATNGFLIDKDNVSKISQVFDIFQISLDGPEKIHNEIRGNKFAFKKVIRAVELLKKSDKNPYLTISSVITSHNFPYLEEMAKIISKLNVDLWKIITLMPIGKAKNNKKLFLSKDQFHNLLKFAQKNAKRYKIQLAENMGHLGKYETKARSLPFLCPIGLLTLCIGVDGNIRGCPEQPDIPRFQEGNVLKEDISSIWQKGFKKYRDLDLVKNEECQKCRYKNDCRGGCWVMNIKGMNCSVKRYCL